jgi:restriction endonuclease S subunit
MQYSIVNYKTIKENFDFRIDADYYMPIFLSNEQKIHNTKWKKLNEISKKITDFGAYSQNNIVEYKETGKYFFIRNQDIKNFFLEEKKTFIDESVYNQLSLHLEKNDILVQRVGTLGKAGIVLKKDLPSTANQNLAQIKPNELLINPFYLITFLNSKFGELYFKRLKTGNVQPWLNLQQIKGLKIPILSTIFQTNIEKIVNKVYLIQFNSKSLYSQASQFLLSELNLLNWQPKHKLWFVKNYSDTQEAERIDAEYFQPMYEDIEKAIKKYSNGFDIIKNHFKQNKKSFKKIADKDYYYIEIGSINISDGSMSLLILKGDELPANAKIKLNMNDILVSKVRPYRGAIGIVTSDDYVGSGAFTVLQKKGSINKETLLIFLRTKPLLDYSLKFNTGTSYPTITDKDILNFPLPLIDKTTQDIIKSKVEEAISSKNISKQLLEIAKLGVEMAIEKDEKQAEKWINEELEKIGIEI